MSLADVFPKDIASEIVFRIAPNRMDVIAVILNICNFHEECLTLDAVVIGLPGSQATRPAKA